MALVSGAEADNGYLVLQTVRLLYAWAWARTQRLNFNAINHNVHALKPRVFIAFTHFQVHPSGLSAHRGFFGCRHFSQANAFLAAGGGAPIDWQIE